MPENMSVTAAIAQACESLQIHLSRPGGQREGPFSVEEINSDLAARRYSDSDYWAWYEGLETWIPLHAVPGVKAAPAEKREFIPRAEQDEPLQDEQLPEYAALPEEMTPDVVASGAGPFTDIPEPPEAATFNAEAFEKQLADPAACDEIQSSGEQESQLPESFSGQTAAAVASQDRMESPRAAEPATEMVPSGAPSKIYSGITAEALDHIFVFTTGEGPALRESGIATMMLLEMIGEDPDALRHRVIRDVFGKTNIGQRIRS